jgi:hypothetical protein
MASIHPLGGRTLSKQILLLALFFFEAVQYHHFGVPAQLRGRPTPVDMLDADS